MKRQVPVTCSSALNAPTGSRRVSMLTCVPGFWDWRIEPCSCAAPVVDVCHETLSVCVLCVCIYLRMLCGRLFDTLFVVPYVGLLALLPRVPWLWRGSRGGLTLLLALVQSVASAVLTSADGLDAERSVQLPFVRCLDVLRHQALRT